MNEPTVTIERTYRYEFPPVHVPIHGNPHGAIIDTVVVTICTENGETWDSTQVGGIDCKADGTPDKRAVRHGYHNPTNGFALPFKLDAERRAGGS